MMATTLYAVGCLFFVALTAVSAGTASYGWAIIQGFIAILYGTLAVLSDRRQVAAMTPNQQTEETVSYGEYRGALAESYSGTAEAAGSGAGAVAPVDPGPKRADLTIEGSGEDSGVIVGEVLGYRAWTLLGPYIASAMGAIWMPGQVTNGSGCDIGNSSGVHAFKRYEDAAEYFRSTRAPYIVGIVRLWGTVVEHRTGYRGEFGAPDRFIAVFGCMPQRLAECAQFYGVEADV